jgi:hypothetical protein
MPDKTENAASARAGPDLPSALRLELTAEQFARGRAAVLAALAESMPAYEMGQLSLFTDEDEDFIRREVERMLYEPSLPNGGGKERRVIERLKQIAVKAGGDWQHQGRAYAAMAKWRAVLAVDPRNPGRYYTRKPMTMKFDSVGVKLLRAMEESAEETGDREHKWFARLLLDGLPEPVSDFKMECLFLLRKSDGSVDRLVRLRNMVGEVSRGEHHGGSVVLDEHAFASPERFREWCLKWGNFNWSGNQTDLHKLQEDIGRLAAWQVINRVDSVGWFTEPDESRRLNRKKAAK